MTASREMPKYQCHKQVWALKIKAIGEGLSNSEFAILQFEDAGYGPLPVSADWHYKHKPEAGGYYVVYEDGYKSYSPASAFESGYTHCAPGPVVFGDEDHVAVPRGLIGAACSAIEHKREGTNTLTELRRYTFGDKSKAISPAAPIALPVVDPGPDSLEREIQAKADKAPRVTPDDLQVEIAHVEIVKHVSHSGQVLRWAVLTARNGYAVVGRPSVSVSPENDNAEIGERVAIGNSKEELWPLLGFRLRDKLSCGLT